MNVLIFFLTTLLAFCMAAPHPAPKLKIGMGWSQRIDAYCNRGWGGDGGCEAQGLHTFCCQQDPFGEFEHSKFNAIDAGLGGCKDGGTILCAE